jgi:catechol 2,3-dioxygenase-like lactoylglutathione lyase family enzyme
LIKACRIGHATLETPDLTRAIEHYVNLVGLVVTMREKDQAVLSTAIGEEVLVLKSGSAARLTHLSFQADPGADLNDAKRYLKMQGVSCELRRDVTPSVVRALNFMDPGGVSIDFFTTDRVPLGGDQAHGIVPLKLGHIAFAVPKAKVLVDFYTQHFGFRVSDWMGDYFAFLRCGPDHHTLKFLDGEHARVHHIAFELKDWAHVQSACELLGQCDRKIIWGPGRHGVGHNIFIYHRDDDDHIVEFYIEMDQMKNEELGYFEPRPWHKDKPQRPKVWERMPAALTWGPPPTEEFLRTHFRRT